MLKLNEKNFGIDMVMYLLVWNITASLPAHVQGIVDDCSADISDNWEAKM